MAIPTTANYEAMKTNHQPQVWLIGTPAPSLCQTKKLPLLRETLSVFFYHHNELNMVLKENDKLAVQQILDVWKKAGIPTPHQHDIVKWFLKIHKE